jgi:hypothetical protein
MKLVTYFMAPEPISTAYIINPSLQSVCLNVYPSYHFYESFCKNVSLFSLPADGTVNTFLRQRIHATIEELFDESFSMWFVSYQRHFLRSPCLIEGWSVGQLFLGKDVPAATKNCWRLHFSVLCRIRGK